MERIAMKKELTHKNDLMRRERKSKQDYYQREIEFDPSF